MTSSARDASSTPERDVSVTQRDQTLSQSADLARVEDAGASRDQAVSADLSPPSDMAIISDLGFTDDLYVSPPDDYEGDGLSPLPSSGMFLTADQFARAEVALSVPTRRFLPQEFTQDQAYLQPWLMYVPRGSDQWVWLLMAIYAPEGSDPQLLASAERAEVQRLGAWHQKTGAMLVAVSDAEVDAVLATAQGAPVCGGARIAARFSLRFENGAAIENVLGVAMTVTRQEELDLNWLRGCDYTGVSSILLP